MGAPSPEPSRCLWQELSVGDIFDRFNAWYIVGVAYGTFALLSVLVPVAYGPSYSSMVRYSTVIFPLYIVLARFTLPAPVWVRRSPSPPLSCRAS